MTIPSTARLGVSALVLAAILSAGAASAAESRYAPDAPPELLASLKLRCHVGLTCPLKLKDYQTFLRALDGDHDAEIQIGEQLERGQGIPADRDAAAEWYGRAAEGGRVRAALALNRLYRAGAAIHANEATIAASLRRGSEKGDTEAMRALADMYFYGRGVTRNTGEAIRLLNRASAAGSKAAAADIARLQQASGAGVPR